MGNLTAAQQARQAAALDRPVRLDGTVTTWRELIESGKVAYTTERVNSDGTRRYGLILHDDVMSEAERINRDGMNALTFVSYWETPKMVADWPLYNRVVQFGYDGVEIRLPGGTVVERHEPTL